MAKYALALFIFSAALGLMLPPIIDVEEDTIDFKTARFTGVVVAHDRNQKTILLDVPTDFPDSFSIPMRFVYTENTIWSQVFYDGDSSNGKRIYWRARYKDTTPDAAVVDSVIRVLIPLPEQNRITDTIEAHDIQIRTVL